MILKPRPVSTRQFRYDGVTATFTADISSTHGLGQVYDDAVDEGLTLVSSRTGRERVFAVTDIERDTDGTIQLWHLTAIGPGAAFKMILFND